MKTPKQILLAALAASLILPSTIHAQPTGEASQPDVNSAIESLRADLHADKVAIIGETMKFTPKESEAFWPIYNRFAADMSKVNDERIALVKDYAAKYDTLTDVQAKDMVTRMFSFEQRRLDVMKKYFKEFSAKLPAQAVAKFYQLENRLNLLVDVNLASSLPALLEKPVNQ